MEENPSIIKNLRPPGSNIAWDNLANCLVETPVNIAQIESDRAHYETLAAYVRRIEESNQKAKTHRVNENKSDARIREELVSTSIKARLARIEEAVDASKSFGNPLIWALCFTE